MKLKQYTWPLLAILSFAVASRASVNMSITPSTVSNTYSGTVTLQVTGITNGETVLIQKYVDANGNGVVDAGDILWQQFSLTDGQASVFHDGATAVTNLNVPGDTDSTSGNITAALNLPVSGFEQTIVGNYLYVLSSPFGNFQPVTNSLTVTNFPFAQSFSGSVTANGTNVPDAAVLLFQGSGKHMNPVGGTITDNSGNYQISVPAGFYVLVAFKSNFVADTGAASATLGSGMNISTNLSLMSADRAISGSFVDASNSAVGLPGMLVPIQNNGLLTVAFTDTNGNFSAGVISGQWQIQPSDQAISFHNFMRPQNKMQVDATAGSVSGVSIPLPIASAIFYGSVRDGSSQPLANISLSTSDGMNNYDQNVSSYANGTYFAGALSGTNDGWNIQVGSDNNPTKYIYSSPSFNFDQNGGTNLSNGQALLVNFTALLATNTITGHVQDSTNNAITNVQVFASATISGVNFQAQANTDGSGNYSMNVASGNWNVSVDCQGGNNSLDNYFGPGNYQCPNSQSVNINNNNGSANFTVEPCGGVQIFTTSPLPNGQIGTYYSNQLSGASCSGFLNWSLVSGTPPPGISLYSAGAFNGTPSSTGTFVFTVQANDGNGHSTNQTFSLTINTSSAPPMIGNPSKSGSQFQFFVAANAGQNYTIQMSTNLKSTNWSSILVTNPSMNSFFITDPNATNPARFYRVLIGP
jgi:hypothetical protein